MNSSLNNLLAAANQIILGKDRQIRLAVCCLLAKGHLLIEDVPGVGKTMLAHMLAKLFGLDYQRIQFTSDILPADIVGSSVFIADQQRFVLQQGPVFSQMILADEINRASPRAQSALLEAMEERQVTVDGRTYVLAEPFFVIATQNPAHHIGTFPLPESQLDRFLMRIELGYPDRGAERELLSGQARHQLLGRLPMQMPSETLLKLQQAVPGVHASPALLVYPKPDADRTPLPYRGQALAGQQSSQATRYDDFAGIRAYQAGDSMRTIHWKAYAKGQGLLTKQFSVEAGGNETWLDFDRTGAGHTEARLGQLCRWVLDAEKAGLRYGLLLPGRKIAPDSGAKHQANCLAALALYEAA
ncbi:MAG: AAA family ATPase [Gammaproteobacteria bacterium]